MSDLISGSALLDDMQKELEKAVNSEDMTEFECKVLMTSALALKGFVNRQPTIEAVEVVHGEWEEITDDWNHETIYSCSVCKEDFVTIDGTPAENLYNFCPNCGADMRKGGAK